MGTAIAWGTGLYLGDNTELVPQGKSCPQGAVAFSGADSP